MDMKSKSNDDCKKSRTKEYGFKWDFNWPLPETDASDAYDTISTVTSYKFLHNGTTKKKWTNTLVENNPKCTRLKFDLFCDIDNFNTNINFGTDNNNFDITENSEKYSCNYKEYVVVENEQENIFCISKYTTGKYYHDIFTGIMSNNETIKNILFSSENSFVHVNQISNKIALNIIFDRNENASNKISLNIKSHDRIQIMHNELTINTTSINNIPHSFNVTQKNVYIDDKYFMSVTYVNDFNHIKNIPQSINNPKTKMLRLVFLMFGNGCASDNFYSTKNHNEKHVIKLLNYLNNFHFNSESTCKF